MDRASAGNAAMNVTDPAVLQTLTDPGAAADSKEQSAAVQKPLSVEERRARILRMAYSNAERRGFEPGFALDDWLAAEREVDDARTSTEL